MKKFKSVSVLQCRRSSFAALAKKLTPTKASGISDNSASNERIIRRPRPPAQSQSFRDNLVDCKSSNEIIQELRNNANKVNLDKTVYGKAMQLCEKMDDYKAVKKIMDMLLNTKTEISQVEFTIFFNAMSKAEASSICYKYFQKMTDELKIDPSVIIFSTLIKSCRKLGKYQLAEQYWKLMENTYNIKPNHFVYTEMISVYSNANQCDKAIEKFKEWLSITNEIDRAKEEHLTIFGANLNIYSRIGDIFGMNTSIQLMKKYKHNLDITNYVDLMRGCIVARKPHKALEYYDRIKKNKIKPSKAAINRKGIAMQQLLRESKDLEFKKKFKLYCNLIRHNNTEYSKYGYTPDEIAASIHLSACISLYHNEDPTKIVEIFEQYQSLNKENNFKYIKQNNGYNMIDLHDFQYLTAQFLLRYIIGYKLNEFDLFEKNDLYIIVGKGKHNNSAGITYKYGLKEFVKDELSTFDPPIKCEAHRSNLGVLVIPKEQLLPYLNNNTNYATEKLTNPSNDWYFDDQRDKNVGDMEQNKNTLIEQHSMNTLIQQRNAKNIDSDGLSRIYPKSEKNQNIRNSLARAKSVKDVLKTLENKDDYIEDESVYSKALQQCKKLNNRDHRIINKIMDMMLLNPKVTPNIIVFNVFFNAMSFCDEPLQCKKYVDIVLNGNKYNGITPDHVTFTTLIKSCRNQGYARIAENYLKIMKGRFNMKPCLFTYTEMLAVYARSFEKDKAIKIFNEYLSRKDLEPHQPLYGAYLNVFSRNGDIQGMEKVIQMIKDTNPEFMSSIIYSNIMRTFVVAGKPRKCLQVYGEVLNNPDLEIEASHLSLACIAMSHLIHCKTVDKQEKYELYAQINDIMDNKYSDYGYTVSSVEIKPLFEACIGLYCNEDPIKIVELFESLLKRKLIGYTKFDNLYGDNALDLHGFHQSTAQFILRYVIGYKLKELLSIMDESNDFVIIVGKGKHSGDNKGILKQFIMNELSSFDPPIKYKKYSKDAGTILINKSHLKHYIVTEKNKLTEILTTPSNDWFLRDVVDE